MADRAQVWSAYQTLRQTQWLDREQLEERQLRQVRCLLTHCRDQVPYYRELLRREGIAPDDVRTLEDFRRLPVLQRLTYQDQPKSFQARALPPGIVGVGEASTSGTSGIPVTLSQTNLGLLWWQACYLRDLEWCGMDPRLRLAAIRSTYATDAEFRRQFMEGTSSPCWHLPTADLIESGPCFGMDVHQDPQRQLEWLLNLAPDYLVAYPSTLDFLAVLLRERQQRPPGLRLIQTIAETLAPEVQNRIEEAFGVPVKNLYSCVEAGYLASPCPEGHGLHVHAENVLLEVLDPQGQPCAPGQVGDVVLTNLHNFLTPFIRYRILDEAECGAERCPCGRGLPLLTRVWGKRRPLFQLRDGRHKITIDLQEHLGKLVGIRQRQLIQRTLEQVVVRVVPGAGWTDDHRARIRQLVDAFFETSMQTEVEVLERLPLPARGKLLSVICEVSAEASGPSRSTLPTRPETTSEQAGNVSQSPPLASERESKPSVRNPATVLLAWELGSGLGHVSRLLRLGCELSAHGHRPVFALRNLVEPAVWFRDRPFPVLQAPLWPTRPDPSGQPFQAASFADILAVHGFAAVEDLWPMVQAWQGLIDLVRPSLIIGDFTPTLCLAAYRSVPVVLVGSGFSLPPAEGPAFPTVVPGATARIPQERLLEVIQQVQRRRGRPYPDTLPGLLAAERFLTVLAELDPYRHQRHERHLGPVDPLPAPLPWPAQPGYLAYLSAEYPAVEQVLGLLARTGVPGKVYVRSASGALRARLEAGGAEVRDQPWPLAEVLAQVSVVVHHGGVSLAQSALAAGRPQLLFPQHVEQLLSASALHELGVAHFLKDQFPAADVSEGLRQLLTERRFRDRADRVARGIQQRGLGSPLRTITERCLALLQ